MTSYGYARVSSIGQSLETQLEQLASCDRIYQEKVSGATMERPELEMLIKQMRAGDVLVVTKLDRLARSTKDLLEIVEDLKQRKAALKILNMNLDTSTPTGTLMLTMLGAIAQFERELMLERQSEGIAKAKQDGKYKGRVPSAKGKAAQVLTLLASGATRQEAAEKYGIGISSVYRILKAA
jgi:DNA invertase Pin-like site-specific DNA recombinase